MRKFIIGIIVVASIIQLFAHRVGQFVDDLWQTDAVVLNAVFECPAPEAAVHFDFNDCNAILNNTNMDYSEFTPTYSEFVSCADFEVVGGYLYRRFPEVNVHSCTPGVDNSVAMCVSALNECAFQSNSDLAIRFEITVSPTGADPADLSGIRFYERSPEEFQWNNGPSGPNNYPTLYGVRVLKNGVEVYLEEDIATSLDWTIQEFDFSNLPEFTVTETATFQFELLAYCLIGNGATVSAWDIDELSILSCCGDCTGIDPSDGDFDVVVDGCQGETILLSLTDQTSIVSPDLNPVSWEWTITNGSDVINLDGPSVSAEVNNLNTNIALLVTLYNGCTILVEKDYESGFLPIVTASGTLFSCSENDLFLSLSSSIDDSTFPMDVASVHWDITDGFQVYNEEGAEVNIQIVDASSIIAKVTYEFTNGCSISETILLDELDLDVLELIINPIVSECLTSQFELTFENTYNFSGQITPVSFAWTLIQNGVSTTSTEETITTIFNDDDNLTVISEVTLSNDCILQDTLIFDPTTVLPTLAIDKTVLSCDGEMVEFEVSLDQSLLPDVYEVVDVDWTVTIDNISMPVFGDPFTVSLEGEQQLLLFVNVTLSNGCMIELSQLCDAADVFPQADFTYTVEDCNPSNDVFNVTFLSTSPDATSNWIIVIDGSSSEFEGTSFSIDIPAGSNVEITLLESYGNGCSSEFNYTTDFFDPSPELNIISELGSCTAESITVDLSAEPIGNTLIDIAEYSWTITQGGAVVNENSSTVNFELDDEAIVTLDVVYSNGCTASAIDTITTVDVLPEILTTSVAFRCSEDSYLLQLGSELSDASQSVQSVEWTIGGSIPDIVLSGANVDLELSSIEGITATVEYVLDSGCSIVAVLDNIPTEEVDLNVVINPSLISCTGDSYNLQFENELNYSGSITDVTYNWTINLNGLITNESTEVISVAYDEGDVLQITSEVTVGGNCSATDVLDFNIEDVLAILSINKNILSCSADSVMFEVSLNEDDLQSEFTVVDKTWTVFVDGQLINVTDDPFELTIGLGEQVDVEVLVEFDNGCSIVVTDSFTGADVLPQVSISYEISDCTLGADGYEVVFSPETDAQNGPLQETNWTFNIDGDISNFTSNQVVLNIEEGSTVSVELDVLFENGCEASASEVIESFEPLPELSMLVDILACTGDEVEVNLISIIDSGIQTLDVESYTWTILNGTNTSIFDTETVSTILENIDTEITLEVLFSNGCTASITEVFEGGVLPNLEIKGTAARCDDSVFEVECIVCYPDSLISIDLDVVEWTVTTVDGVFNFTGDTIRFSITDLNGLNAEVTASTLEGCTLTGESDKDVVVVLPTLDIASSAASCVDSVFAIELYNVLGFTNGLLPESFDWTILQNGISTTYTSDTILVEVSPGDTLFATSTVNLIGDCVLIAESVIVVDESLPTSDIILDLLVCTDDMTVVAQVSSIDDIPADLMISSESWEVNIGGTINTFDSAPFDLNLNVDDELTITHIINFSNGCSIEVTESFNVNDILPQATFTYMVADCDIMQGDYQVTFVSDSTSATSNWTFVINGMVSTAMGTSVVVDIPAGALVEVTLDETYANGCSASSTQTVENFDPAIDVSFLVDVLACTDNQMNVNLLSIIGNGINSADVETYHWLIENGGNVLEFDTENVEVLLDDVSTTITLEVIFVNGCVSTYTHLFEGGVIPSLEVKGTAASCTGTSFQVELFYCYPDSIISLDILDATWQVTTVDGVIDFIGDTIQFEVIDLIDLAAVVTVETTEGCTLTGQLVDDIPVISPEIEIAAETIACVDSFFQLQLWNNFIATNGLTPESFDWTVNLNGDITNYTTDTIVLNVMQGDSLTVVSTVDFGDGCVLSTEAILDVNDFLPQSEIIVDVVACLDEENITLQISSIDDIPDFLVITSDSWIVNINDVITMFDSAPFEIDLNALDTALVSHVIEFENGCSIEVIRSLNFEDLQPQAAFTYTLGDCNPLDSIYDVTFTSLDPDATSSWVIDIDGMITELSGSSVNIQIPTGANVIVTLNEVYDNGCTASTTEFFEAFDPGAQVTFFLDIVECIDDAIEIELFPIFPAGVDGADVVSYNWTINNGGVITTFDTDTVMTSLANVMTEITLDVEFANGCTSSYTQLFEDGILPTLEIKGTAASCGDSNFQVQYIVCYPDSIIGLELTDINWTVETVDGQLMFTGDTIQFELMDLTGLSATVTALTAEGCMLSGETEGDITIVTPSLEIGAELGACVDSMFTLQLYNILIDANGLDPDSFNWTIDQNGTITNYDTDTINVEVMQGDTLIVMSEVNLMGQCIVSADSIFIIDEILPTSDIVVTLVECPNSFSVVVEVSSIDTFPPGYEIESEEWIVDVNGVITMFDSAPFELTLFTTSEALITHNILFTNGCSISVSEMVDPNELIPDATFEIEGIDCNIDSNQVTFIITNTTMIDTFSVDSIRWIIIINGESTMYTQDTVTLTVENGTTVTISHMVTFSNGCVASGLEVVTIDIPTIEFTDNPLIVCGAEDVPLVANPNPDWEYIWDPEDGLTFPGGDMSNPIVNVDENTTFIVTVTNGICDVVDTIDVIVSIMDTLSIVQSDDDCDGNILLTIENADPDLTYEWSTDIDFTDIFTTGSMIEVMEADTFYVQYMTMDTCVSGFGEIIVSDDFLLSFDAPNPMMFCEGDTMVYTITNTNTTQEIDVIWQDDPHILSPLDSNSISVTIFEGEDEFVLTAMITNEFGCDSTVNITFMAGIINDLGFEYDFDCETLLVCFTQNSDFVGTVIWDFGDPTTELDQTTEINPCYTYPIAGDYIVTLTPDNISCNPEPFQSMITITDTIAVEIGADTNTIFQTKELELFVIDPQPGHEYIWSTGEITSTITVSPDSDATFSVTVTDVNGCVGMDEFAVTVLPIQCNEDGIFIPNAFSPNGDGVNDILYVRSNCLESIDFVIYNRWGEEIFRTTDPLAGWDGTFQNEQLSPDAYGYSLRAVCATGEVYMTQGNVSIIR